MARNRRYARDFDPALWGGYYPPVAWGGGPFYGLEAGGLTPYAPRVPVPGYGPRRGYGYDYRRRRPPEQSASYGRGGDREIRRWARRRGYDVGYAIRPRRRGYRR